MRVEATAANGLRWVAAWIAGSPPWITIVRPGRGQASTDWEAGRHIGAGDTDPQDTTEPAQGQG